MGSGPVTDAAAVRRRLGVASLIVVAVVCVMPLWVGLGRADVDNDEAIYTFAVDQMLRNGDWLTPRSAPNPEAPFLEKPPLKFWLVAGAIRLGLLPHDQFGTRAWDALFGSLAFCYVAALGVRIGSPLAGVLAALILFVHRPLLFDHGLRSNNMDAALVVAYCAGVYHYLAWRAARPEGRSWPHIAAMTAAFGLGFMTKFVAAAFLPAFLVPVTLLSKDGRAALRRDWVTWVAAGVALGLACAPWFLYQRSVHGPAFWQVLVGTHVVQRFGRGLDPNHLQPWTYYVAAMTREWMRSRTVAVIVAGLVYLAVVAWHDRHRRVAALTVLSWAIVPTALVSMLSSKLFHYAYPFLPAMALAGGIAAADAAGVVDRRVRKWLDRPDRAPRAAAAAGAAAVVLLLLAVGAVPVRAYVDTVRMTRTERAPLRTLRDCLAPLARQRAGRDGQGPGVWGEASHLSHIYFHYLQDLGPWNVRRSPSDPTVFAHLYAPRHYRPVLLSRDRYDTFMALVRAGDTELVERAARKAGDPVAAMRDAPASTPMGYVQFPEVVFLLPGPFSVCGTTR